ncbi:MULTISPECIES: ureidoglycolate lyase [unclassified Aurantimonas]|uniref:ureidoglycolate lyase n=1 Tax=unclassified Aurantimonas TaxID=2638230 RepID=UPI002E199F76|nr:MULTISPECIES: ureidoglycolate lyase [unclassified Aurantimonas]MEC5293671.1 ureidoglycolate lyase [Aurantimonas sp. C2-3-R2]MEC5414734.1 ureidoglycolate lyase [Aurantimonas sp. C2-4-R8]
MPATTIQPSAAPLEITLLERHRFSTQTFLPLSAEEYLVIVAPPDGDGTPDLSQVRAFKVPGDAAITYAAGIWHHPMIALRKEGRFAVFMWRDGGPDDEEFMELKNPFLIYGN